MKKANKGFTLVELLAVIVILAIIMIIAIPAVLHMMSSAKRKSFEEFALKSSNEAEKKLLQLQIMNEGSSNCTIYNIKNDLDLSSTGDFDGYVLLKNNNDSIEKIIVLWNNDFMLLPYNISTNKNYYGEKKEIADSIENYDRSKFDKLTPDTLCGTGCTSCSFNKTVVEATCNIKPGDVINFDYTGGEQIFTVPCNGTYYLKAWGGQGGDANSYLGGSYHGGYGAYASGSVELTKGTVLYINVGGAGTDSNIPSNDSFYKENGGYNGGGYGISAACIGYGNRFAGAGGGAYGLTNWVYGDGGNAGGIIGNSPTWYINNSNHKFKKYPIGGSQTIGGNPGYSWKKDSNNFGKIGSFGKGGDYEGNKCSEGAGGGAGLFGGGSAQHGSGAGGSSYIGYTGFKGDNVMYCMDCQESNEAGATTISTTGSNIDRNTDECFSGFSENPVDKCAKAGNGYFSITYGF